MTATAATEYKLTDILAELEKVILAYENLIAECRLADSALKRLEADENRLDSKWKEDARRAAIQIDACETKSITNQQIFNVAFYRMKSSLRAIEGIQSKDFSISELAKRQEVSKKAHKMLELYKSTAPLLSDIKSRYKAVSYTDNRFES